jgi:hypothetical protein
VSGGRAVASGKALPRRLGAGMQQRLDHRPSRDDNLALNNRDVRAAVRIRPKAQQHDKEPEPKEQIAND